jgi:hypothetical protein
MTGLVGSYGKTAPGNDSGSALMAAGTQLLCGQLIEQCLTQAVAPEV